MGLTAINTDTMTPATHVSPYLKHSKIDRVLKPKAQIYHQGDEARHIFKVMSGMIMTYRILENSQRLITGFSVRGDYIGLTPYNEHHDTATSLTMSTVAVFNPQELQQYPLIQSDMMNWAFGQLVDSHNMMMLLSKKSAAQKVAAFLLMMAQQLVLCHPSNEIDNIYIDLPMSRSDIADYLGLTIETVSRQFTDLKLRGVIELPNRSGAKLLNIQMLKALAGAMV